MKLECNFEKLKNSIGQVEKVTGKNLTLPILSSILLIASGKTLKLRATNLSVGVEIEIPAKIEKEGVIAVSGSVLSNVFSNIFQTENIILEESENNIIIKTKKSKIKLKCQPYEDFPTIPVVSGDSFNIDSTKLVDGIKSVYYSSAVSDIKPEISSVYVYSNEDSLVFVSTDSFRLAEKKVKIKGIVDVSGILLPFKNIPEIIRIFGDIKGDLTVFFNKNQISIAFEGVYFTSRVIDGIFPDYKQIMPKENTTEAIILKQDLLSALKLSNIFSDKFNQLNLVIKPKEKVFEISSSNSIVGENNTTLDAALTGENVELSFNYKYFLDCLTSVNSDSLSLKLNQANRPMVISGVSDTSFTYLIMPMNR
ncbi:MAG: DNA polymerase III subunit beta [Candidatus Nomurabacteria bacterium]|nr:DNA polymerase III subunit beta [Candidatus Nomurabacteria bacterium]